MGFLRVGADETIDPEETRFQQLMASIQPAFSVWVSTWSSETGRRVTERNPHIPEPQPAEPCRGVLLGDLDDVYDMNGLVDKEVGSVICLCPEKVPDVSLLAESLRRTHSIDLVPIWADDDRYYDVLAHLPLVKETIDRDKQRARRTLVQCWAGVNRSATLVVAYMNAHLGIPLLRAFRETVRLRGEVVVNGHFRSLLIRAARSRGEVAEESGVATRG